MDITCALKSIGLTWHEPSDISSLCHRCGRPGCNPDKCALSRAPQCPFRPWSSNDKLRELYNKHLTPSHPAKHHNHFTRPANSEQRSYANAAEDQHSSPPIQRSSQPQVPLPPVTDSIDQGWDNNEPSDPRRLSDNLMDFSFPVSPQQGSNFIAQSHIPLPPRMSLIPGPATSPQDRLFSLTAK
ncbi:hypothetical protein RhiirA5_441645, partial [Rhizophagus irregularis]